MTDEDRLNRVPRRRLWSTGTRRPTLSGRVAIAAGITLVAVALIVLGLTVAQVSRGHAQATIRRSPLDPPTGLFASGVSSGAILLSWNPPRHAPVGYRIYRATGRHGRYDILGIVSAPDIDTFTDEGDLTPGMTYAYTVTAFDRSGQSAPVGPIVAVVVQVGTTPSPIPVVPTPLPTFVPVTVTSPTLTAIAHSAARVGTPSPSAGTPGAVPVSTQVATVPVVPALTPTPPLTTATPPGKP